MLERCRNHGRPLTLILETRKGDQHDPTGGRSGYKQDQRNDVADQVVDRTRELAEEALDRADEWLKPTGLSIKERPMTVLAVVGGLAFAAGAIWMLRNSRQQSNYDRVLADPFGPAPPSRVALATEEFLIRSSDKLSA